MAGLVTLQNLQNLASLQNLPQVASLAAGLSSMGNLSGNPSVNAPLNLSVSASGNEHLLYKMFFNLYNYV